MGKVPSFLVEVSSSYWRFVVAASHEVIEVNDFFSQLLRSLAFAPIDFAHFSLRSKGRHYSFQARAISVEKRSRAEPAHRYVIFRNFAKLRKVQQLDCLRYIYIQEIHTKIKTLARRARLP